MKTPAYTRFTLDVVHSPELLEKMGELMRLLDREYVDLEIEAKQVLIKL